MVSWRGSGRPTASEFPIVATAWRGLTVIPTAETRQLPYWMHSMNRRCHSLNRCLGFDLWVLQVRPRPVLRTCALQAYNLERQGYREIRLAVDYGTVGQHVGLHRIRFACPSSPFLITTFTLSLHKVHLKYEPLKGSYVYFASFCFRLTCIKMDDPVPLQALSPLDKASGSWRRRQSMPSAKDPNAPLRPKRKSLAQFQCNLSSKRFIRAFSLRFHRMNYAFSFTVCGKTFASRQNQTRHQSLHATLKYFVWKGDLPTGDQWGSNYAPASDAPWRLHSMDAPSNTSGGESGFTEHPTKLSDDRPCDNLDVQVESTNEIQQSNIEIHNRPSGLKRASDSLEKTRYDIVNLSRDQVVDQSGSDDSGGLDTGTVFSGSSGSSHDDFFTSPALNACQSRTVERLMAEITSLLSQNLTARRRGASRETGGDGTSNGSYSSNSSAKPQPPSLYQANSGRKRTRRDEDERSNAGDRDGGDIKNPRLELAPSVGSPQRFACPYYRRNSHKHVKHRSCAGPGWSSVHRVK